MRPKSFISFACLSFARMYSRYVRRRASGERQLRIRKPCFEYFISAIVAGNVKEHGIRQIEQHGPFTIHGDTLWYCDDVGVVCKFKLRG